MQILVLSRVHEDALRRLEQEHEVIREFAPTQAELPALAQSCDVLVLRSGVEVNASTLAAATNLRLVIRAGSGTDNIDLAEAARRDVRVVTIPEPGGKAVAEMAFALMLALARNVVEADRNLRSGHWCKHELTGRSLGGKTLGVLGAGNIGSRVGRLGAAWGMRVLGVVDRPTRSIVQQLQQQSIQVVSTEGLLDQSDFVSVHVPLTDRTRHLIDATALARMKPGSFLVNLARGGVVDEEALRVALVEGRLGGAALDVHAAEGEGKVSPLAGLPNVVLTPHIGAGTAEAQAEIGERVLALVAEHAAGRIAPLSPAHEVASSEAPAA